MALPQIWRDLAQNPNLALTTAGDTPVVGYAHLHVPPELIEAAGAVPVRLLGAAPPYTMADAHMQAYTCSLSRGLLEQWLTGSLDSLKTVIFGHACDTLQRLEAVLRNAPRGPQVCAFYVPINRASGGAFDFLRSRITRLAGDIAGFMGGEAIDDTALAAAMQRSDRMQQAARRLWDAHRSGAMPFIDLYDALLAAQLMDREQWLELAETYLADLAAPASDSGIPIGLYGGPIVSRDVAQALSQSGARVVFDMTGTGGLVFPVVDTGADFGALRAAHPEDDDMSLLARRFLAASTDPTTLPETGEDEMPAYVAMARQQGARGMLAVRLKFCEPWGFDEPPLMRACKNAGLPCNAVEYEISAAPSGQIETRIGAFIEMLS